MIEIKLIIVNVSAMWLCKVNQLKLQPQTVCSLFFHR